MGDGQENFRFGEPRVFVPVSHPDRMGGPVGYLERLPGEEGECPIEVKRGWQGEVKTMAEDTRQLKSYVWCYHTSQCFFVSTIERDSSAMGDPPARRFMETIAWEYDWETGKRGKQVAETGSGYVLTQHFEMCRQLYETSEYIENEKEI